MSKLEKRLREVAAAGELTYLSVVPVAGKGPNDLVFVATYSPASRFGNIVVRDADPAVAILDALNGDPTREELVTPLRKTANVGLPGGPVNSGEPPLEPEPWDN
jgi:hypothetical protein